MPAQALAHVGDAVHALCVRCGILSLGPISQRELHARSTAAVHAAAQAGALATIEPLLTAEERDVVRRARNAKLGKGGGGSPADRHLATAFEALLGFLYLSGRDGRLQELLALVSKACAQEWGGEPGGGGPVKTHT
jgi:ribonuclease-3 family protein